MTITLKPLIAALALALGPSGAALAEEVTMRFLAQQGGISAHELAYDLGYFKGTGITLENVGDGSCPGAWCMSVDLRRGPGLVRLPRRAA